MAQARPELANKTRINIKIEQRNRKTKPASTKQARPNKSSQQKTQPMTSNWKLTSQIKLRRRDWIRKDRIVENLIKQSRETEREESYENKTAQVRRICAKLFKGVGQNEPKHK